MERRRKVREGSILAMAGCLIWLAAGFATAQTLDHPHARIVFAEANQAMKAAREANADLLAPKAWTKAVESLKLAESVYLRGKDMKQVRATLRLGVSEFQVATDDARRAVAVFGNALQARMDAQRAEANRVAKIDWDKAEEKLKTGASNLELGFERVARGAAQEAEKLYRSAELKAVKEFILSEAYTQLDKAVAVQAGRYAPKTLQKAQDIIALCEEELKENREDTDMARILAIQARREARHAVYIAQAVKSAGSQNLTLEDVLLASEGSLRRVADILNLSLTYEEGFKKSTDEIVQEITVLTTENRKMRTGLFDAGQLVNLLRDRNAELLARLGEVEVEKTEIALRLEYQARLDETYAAVERLFEGENVLTFREGNALRIRLTGLGFIAGKNRVEPRYYPFLDKVVEAVRMFPKASVVVEGHTDAVGPDDLNMQLSYDRAENVMLYLNTKLNLDPSAIQATGYGESRPIATNETEEGRAKNRRVAVVIHPQFE